MKMTSKTSSEVRGLLTEEIYNGYAGFFDFGPLGCELKKNMKDAFWLQFVHCREDIVGIDSSIIHNPQVRQASGHLDRFQSQGMKWMMETNVSTSQDSGSVAYLRPESSQGIFINFKNVLETSRKKIPFGIAQIGKVFRSGNHGSSLLWCREFEVCEIEYFIPPGDDIRQHYHEQWIKDATSFLKSIGLKEELLGFDVHGQGRLAHYATACTDITFQFPNGEQPLLQCVARGDFDLRRHSEGSGKVLDYLDLETKKRYIPHVIEISTAIERLILASICSAYTEDELKGEKRNYLSFAPSIAPVKVNVLPLVKNKEPLMIIAKEILTKLQKRWNVAWDQSGSIGKRYRRADEVGVPCCITVDFETLTDDMVTVRERDSAKQSRIPIIELESHLSKMFG